MYPDADRYYVLSVYRAGIHVLLQVLYSFFRPKPKIGRFLASGERRSKAPVGNWLVFDFQFNWKLSYPEMKNSRVKEEGRALSNDYTSSPNNEIGGENRLKRNAETF